ncbi:hypothetical protein AAKU67_001898 [Oxalobacteraceae bacterium GrIS 2.11]
MANDDFLISGFGEYTNDDNVSLLVPVSTLEVMNAEKIRIESLRSEAERDRAIAAKNLAAHKSNNSEPPPDSMDVKIFCELAIEKMARLYVGLENASQSSGKAVFTAINDAPNGFRTVPRPFARDVKQLRSHFENMSEPITQILDELELMAYMPKEEFRITPILLLGPPGIGKTAFAYRLAKTLSLPFCKVKGAEPSFSLTGSHHTLTKASPGLVLQQLAVHNSAAPVFLVDELEKGGEDRYPISNPLLDLLEPETSRRFKDEFFQMEFNASHSIWIMTANSIHDLSEPLISRASIFNIQPPSQNQRARIIRSELESLRNKSGFNVVASSVEIAKLAERTDLDLRFVSRIVRSGFMKALNGRSVRARWDLPPKSKRSIGFL